MGLVTAAQSKTPIVKGANQNVAPVKAGAAGGSYNLDVMPRNYRGGPVQTTPQGTKSPTGTIPTQTSINSLGSGPRDNLGGPVQTTPPGASNTLDVMPRDYTGAPDKSTKPIKSTRPTPPVISPDAPLGAQYGSTSQPQDEGAFETAPSIGPPGDYQPGNLTTPTETSSAGQLGGGGAGAGSGGGGGTTYGGQSFADTLAESKKGLVDMLDSNDPYMLAARARGNRVAEARGLGGSSFAGRASEGAAIDAVMPLIQQITQTASSERMTAQSLTAQSAVAAADRSSREKIVGMQLAVQSGDAAKARQLERDIQSEANNLREYMQARDLAVQSGDRAEARRLDDVMNRRNIRDQRERFDRNLDVQIEESALGRQLQETLQDNEINYREWLSDATFGNENILRSNQQAMDAYSDFTEASMNILNNPETSSGQKRAALAALREGLTGTLNLLQGVSGLDLQQYVPERPTQREYTDFMASRPEYNSPEYRDWYDEFSSRYSGPVQGQYSSPSTPYTAPISNPGVQPPRPQNQEQEQADRDNSDPGRFP